MLLVVIIIFLIFLIFKLNDVGQEWADELAKSDKAFHRPDNAYGENIYMIKSTEKVTDLGTKAVDKWYEEIKFFDSHGTNEKMAASAKACKVSFFFYLFNLKILAYLNFGFFNNIPSVTSMFMINIFLQFFFNNHYRHRILSGRIFQ